MRPYAGVSRVSPDRFSEPYLERYAERGGPAERVPLRKLPFTIGRSDAADYIVYSSRVSKKHAALVRIGDGVAVHDLASTNGTFVNGRRTSEQVLADGDIIHLAHVEFCFHQHQPRPAPVQAGHPVKDIERTQAVAVESPDSIIRGTALLREMIHDEAVEILYQPIVEARSYAVVGYEALGRGTHPKLAGNTESLLRLAERCELATEVSELFARLAVQRSHRLPKGPRIFVNVHPRHVSSPDFIHSLKALRGFVPTDRPIVIEIPESTVTDVARMAEHRAAFSRLGFEFAYDDFGAGQARLLELTDIPAHYLKLDKSLMRGIEGVPSRQEMVAAVVSVVKACGVQVIAEGIETDEGAAICRELKVDLIQGFLFGPPA
jgi:EAL domain-containing protein (putative c-di-GMP-specific phosphodiesterase class I)